MDFLYLKTIATKAALAAGKIMQQYMDEDIAVERKDSGSSYASQVVTAADKECEAMILSYVLPTCQEFNLALLSEEREDDKSRLEKDFFWCIDPIDGTLPFIEKRPGFSVSIALVARDGTPYIGVVFDPSTNTLYHAVRGNGVYKNEELWEVRRDHNYLTYVTDKTLKNNPQAAKIKRLLRDRATALGLYEIKEIAGAGSVLNGIYVLENGPACMLKLPKKDLGGGSIWDFAATACFYHELGLTATDFEGDALDLNREDDTFMNHQGVFYANW